MKSVSEQWRPNCLVRTDWLKRENLFMVPGRLFSLYFDVLFHNYVRLEKNWLLETIWNSCLIQWWIVRNIYQTVGELVCWVFHHMQLILPKNNQIGPFSKTTNQVIFLHFSHVCFIASFRLVRSMEPYEGRNLASQG